VFAAITTALAITALAFIYKNIKLAKELSTAAARLEEESGKALEAGLESEKVKSEFLAHMGHELRTPLNAIIGMSELALRENTLDASLVHMRTVKQAAASLLSIINNVLIFTKIESGSTQIVKSNYNFSSMINDVISITRMKMLDTRLRFTAFVDGNISGTLIGDELRIRQILLNLLENAVKHTVTGYVSLFINQEDIDGQTTRLIMEIRDSGTGIKKDIVDTLFTPFFDAGPDRIGRDGGVGLGLAITRSLVNAMGGVINVESEYGKGSVFTVRLPQGVYGATKLAVIDNPGLLSVLVLEHREIYAKSIALSMDNLGIGSVTVSNADELNKILAEKNFKFIFTSLRLYDENRALLAAGGAEAEIVLLTEYSEVSTEKGLARLAMPAYCLSIVNVINGGTDVYAGVDGGAFLEFSAPDANILVVDDVQTNLMVTGGLLAPYGMRVDLCESGREAIDAVQTKKYDIVFMDHRMPDVDGLEATRRIRDLGDGDAYYRDLPIVALTANAVPGMREIYIENGMDDYLAKPIDTEKLNAILKKWIPVELRREPVSGDGACGRAGRGAGGFNIRGIDEKRGITLSGGTLEFYIQTLSAFYDEGLRTTEKIIDSLKNDNMRLYAIYVHAVKGAAANIGANELSETARLLELAAQQEDYAFIEEQNGMFLTALGVLLAGIRDALGTPAARQKKGITRVDADVLISGLNRLKKALEDMDAGEINKTLDNLLSAQRAEGYSFPLHDISKSILLAEYDEARALIDALKRVIIADGDGPPR